MSAEYARVAENATTSAAARASAVTGLPSILSRLRRGRPVLMSPRCGPTVMSTRLNVTGNFPCALAAASETPENSYPQYAGQPMGPIPSRMAGTLRRNQASKLRLRPPPWTTNRKISIARSKCVHGRRTDCRRGRASVCLRTSAEHLTRNDSGQELAMCAQRGHAPSAASVSWRAISSIKSSCSQLVPSLLTMFRAR